MKPFFLAFAFLASVGVQAEEIKCHALKFDSYFVAQNVKDNLKKINPDLDHANFAGHYLLLRAELAMETLYLIASCDTGEFFHEKLSADRAEFSVNGPGVDLSDKNETTHFEWNGKSWLKGESKPVAASANLAIPNPSRTSGTAVTNAQAPSANTAASPTPNLLASYQNLFAKYPVQEKMTTCASLDYNSNFRAQKNKESIQKHNPDLTHPNFAGTHLLFTTETIFETVTLIADCKTGKISDEFLKDHVTFQADSRLVIVNSSDTHPELKLWSNSQWIQIPDPVQNQKETISNTLYGEQALLLVHSLPNPEHRDTLRFEKLKVSEETKSLYQELGVDSILSGKCIIPNGQSPKCEVDTQ